MGDNRYSSSIFAPMTGSVVDLSQVPDPIYAERMMGDGVAIVPEDGTCRRKSRRHGHHFR